MNQITASKGKSLAIIKLCDLISKNMANEFNKILETEIVNKIGKNIFE